jgi:hypothetical protein
LNFFTEAEVAEKFPYFFFFFIGDLFYFFVFSFQFTVIMIELCFAGKVTTQSHGNGAGCNFCNPGNNDNTG